MIAVGDALKVVDLLFKGLDKGFEVYTGSSRRLFLEHIDPCFNQMVPIQRDYSQAIRQILVRLEKVRGEDWVDVKDWIINAAEENKIARESMKRMAAVWKHSKEGRIPEEAQQFFSAVASYFCVVYPDGHTWASNAPGQSNFAVISYFIDHSFQLSRTASAKKPTPLRRLKGVFTIHNLVGGGNGKPDTGEEMYEKLREYVRGIQALNYTRWRRVASAHAKAKIRLLH